MGIFAFQNEQSSTVAPAKLYKALTKDSDENIPKKFYYYLKIYYYIIYISIMDGHTSFVLHKVDAIDEANLAYDYSIIGGAGLDETLEKITFESKILAGPDGGSIGKINIKFHTKGDVLSETVRDQAKFKGIGLFKAVEGNGGPGTIKKITAVHDGHTSFVLHKVDAIDEANLAYDYSIIGGAGLDETLEKITFESKILAGPDGGSIGKINIKFHTKGDVLSETVRDQAKFKGIGLFKAVEGYFLRNMAVLTLTDESTSIVQAERLFKALILDAHNLIPKLLPQAIKKVEVVEGNGGPGTIQQITIAEG
ncbi:hypothetical protein Lal_00041185 [Lupinus albus]|nr:hypothetical protein Lal_00041185 [Lupinus albus]